MISILTDKQAFKPVLNTDEVEAIFDAPLEMFLKVHNVILCLFSVKKFSFLFLDLAGS